VRIIHRHCANHVPKNNNCANHLVRESSVARIILLPLTSYCFDTVGWVTGRASDLQKNLDVGLLMVMI